MKNNLLGLSLVAAAIVVVSAIVGLLHSHQFKVHRDKVRVQGVALTRAISSADLPELVSGPGRNSLVSTLVRVQGSDAFAYAAVEAKSGERLVENASAGTIVPPASMPSSDPTTWFGEQLVSSPGDGRNIREFFGPILKSGELAGFVRVGYYERPQSFADDISSIASLALPVFLLTALCLFMIRRETRPLARLSQKLDEIGKVYDADGPGSVARLDYRDFGQRFDQFLQTVESKARETEQRYIAAQTSSRLHSYNKEKANAVLDAIPEGLVVIDASAVPTYANLKIEPLLGISREELIGVEPQKWCRNKEVLALLMRLTNRGGPVIDTTWLEYVPEDHPDWRISVVAYPVFSPRDSTILMGVLLLFREISEEYRARVAGSDFVAQVAHELKTPLSNIAAYNELLLNWATLDDRERVNAVNVIHDETERASALISNLLNISKLEAGTLPIYRERVRMSDLLRDAGETMSKVALTKDITLEMKLAPDLGSARLDKGLFRIALDNLLSNAIKYSNPGGRVTLSAENLDDLQMKISVRDQGIGISAEDCARVFDKYYRSSAIEVTSRGGYGLGLFLAKQIVELHHGTISVNSELGKWTEFTVQFHVQTQQLEK
jgi:two-component system sensor histidine kinase VicK